jgi:hypothetical protein
MNIKFLPVAFGINLFTDDCSFTLIPTSRVLFNRILTKSGSNPARGVLPLCSIVTFEPARAAKWANSNEIYPPPINNTLSGNSSSSRNSSLVITFSSPVIFSFAGFAPVAIKMFSPSIVRPLLFFSSVIRIVLGPINLAIP